MSFVITPLIGGTAGQAFNDLDKLTKNGEFIRAFQMLRYL